MPGPNRNAVDQKIGDYYASCMDEKTIEASGAKPLEPRLQQIAEYQFQGRDSPTSPRRWSPTMFCSASNPFRTSHDANQVIANTDQGGLGLPDRDYYLKTDAKSVELRNDYVAHVQKMFELLGDKPEAAAAEAQDSACASKPLWPKAR